MFDSAKEGSIPAGALRSLLYAQTSTPPPPPSGEGEDDEFLVLIHNAVGDIVGEEVSDETRISFPQFVQLMVNLAPPCGFEEEVAGIHSVLGRGKDVVDAADLEHAETCLIVGGEGEDGGEAAKSSRQELEDAVRTVENGNGITVAGLTALMTHQ